MLLKSHLHFDAASIRSPGPVTPRDVECEGFNLTYPRIANDKLNAISGAHSTLEYDVDKKVDASITTFLTTLSQIGPELLSVSVEQLFPMASLLLWRMPLTFFLLSGFFNIFL
jgi:hypothetical protein